MSDTTKKPLPPIPNDLTGILQYAKKMQDSGPAPEASKGSIMEEIPIEKIDNFESLDDYAAANPAPVPSEPTATPGSDGSDGSDGIDGIDGSDHGDDAPAPEFPASEFPASEFETSEFPTSDVGVNTEEFALAHSASHLQFHPDPISETSPNPPPPTNSTTLPPQKLAFKKDSTTPSADALDHVKKYSEHHLTSITSNTTVPASFPFSILIRGELRPEEKEKLISLIEDHQMGFRLIDLEPQLACGRILIPRISEYAGILIIQALRGTRAEMKLGTSDSIFSTAETHDTEDENFLSSVDESSTTYSSDLSHPAESLPVTPLDRLPGNPKLTLIDTVTANAALKSTAVEAEHSSAFQEIVEALQREIKYKAHRKGATAVLNFKIQINSLSSPTHYRILALGSAVKPSLI